MRIFTLARKAETPFSTWGELSDPVGAMLSKILERGASNTAHKRIPAGTYEIGRKPLWSSHFDGGFKNLIGAEYKGILWLPVVPGRANIEIHTANLVQQLEGCLATGDDIARDSRGDFMVADGTSKPAYARIYEVISPAIDAGGAQLIIKDVEV
jgi:hypothetical protein